jgi:dihydrofolate reductase
MNRKLVLYIAMSLDGYIAKHDGNIDFLSIVEKPNEDYGYSEFLQSIDTVIWGRKTLDKVLTFGMGVPHSDKKVYVISKSREGFVEHAEYKADVVGLVKELKQKEGKNIYCDGGAEIVFELMKHKMFDRIIVSVIPHLLGDGVKLFKNQEIETNLEFKKSISFPSGLVQLWYDVTSK